MDLLALSTFDNLVELYRISYKAQKVFQAEEAHQIKTLAFSPDCKDDMMQRKCWRMG